MRRLSRQIAERPGSGYERACARAARIARALGLARPSQRTRRPSANRRSSRRDDLLGSYLSVAGLSVSPGTVAAAGTIVAVLAAATCASAAAALSLVWGSWMILAAGPVALLAAPVAYAAFVSYAGYLAKKRAKAVLRTAAEGVTLMIMSLRHEASLPNALRFAADDKSPFAQELRGCVWDVISGVHESFEDALLAFADKWSGHCGELRSCVSSIITASKETTQDGRRRALDRASRTIVEGAKRRVEQYAASLSTPSTVLFGLGILLPIMVGSFLPMLSWTSFTGIDPSSLSDGQQGNPVAETVVLMNVLFPSAAVLIALEAVSRHPRPRGRSARTPRLTLRTAVPASIVSGLAAATIAGMTLPADLAPAAMLLAGTSPFAASLLLSGRPDPRSRARELSAEDALFRTGARMAEGDNLESALYRTWGAYLASPLQVASGYGEADASYRSTDGASSPSSCRGEPSPAGDALRMVRRAARIDERAAGMLAMDLSSYLRDLEGIEHSLRASLKPTVSMMRMTAHVLGPLVLGITYAIYVSMAGLGEAGGRASDPGAMLLVLGVFLAEMNLVVCYFVWGIEGRGDVMPLLRSAGACVLASEAVFVLTAALAA